MSEAPGRHTPDEVMALLRDAELVVVATAAGERIRTRMMHFATGPDFSVYLASMRGDPKTLQITHHPAISLLVHAPGSDINDSREVEITGQAVLVRDEEERGRALEATAVKSPVVKHMVETGNAGLLDCIKVVPEVVKLRVFREIVQGIPPTVIDFAQNQGAVSDWALLRTKLSSWAEAVRTLSLTASLVSILLGTAVARSATGTIHWGYLLLALVAGLSIQAGTNLWNDYFDHRSGGDEANREFVRPFSGGSRVIQLGLLSSLEVLGGAILLCLLAAGIGIYLAFARGPLLLAFGVVGLASGIFYSGRPFEWASRGVGEVLVGLNYGVLMTLGAYYVQAQAVEWQPVVAALPVALLITAVLYINEFQDYSADMASGKRTLVVRLGRARATMGFGVLMAAAYVSLLGGVAAGVLPAAALLGLITLPLGARAVLHARRHHSSPFDLAPANALTAISHLGLGLALTLAFAWQGTGVTGLGYVAVLAVLFAIFVGYFYRDIERQRRAFHGLKRALS
jgi:1,4-dihydroxy-2-naphthoate octaprenyltransferase